MNIAPGAQVRVNVRLNMRLAPAVESERVCTVQDGVLVTALAAAHGGWFRARVRGWEHEDHPGLVFSEASASACAAAAASFNGLMRDSTEAPKMSRIGAG